MNNHRTTCNPERIELFLQQKLSDEEQTAFESHMDDCDDCRRQLETAVASEDLWSEVRESLRDEQLLRDGRRSGEFDSAGEDASSSQSTVLKLLAPTDDERMLGRWGTYEVVGVVGTGGMGVVLKAFDAALNRYVAIKVLAPHLGNSGGARKRFSREAQAAAAVVHDNVMEIYGVAETAGLPYLVMPYVRGPSLQRRLDDCGPMALAEILRVGMQAAAGLAAAHAQGLVHRDVKPANILLADGIERVKLTDFGLARAADDASLTKTGVIAGTPQYMSPEQARGEAVDQRSDLFSLGSVLYAMCTGRPPFRAETSYGVLRRITDEEPRPIREINPEIPEWLCRIVAKLMAKRPEDRFQSAQEVAALLEQCLAHVQQPTVVPLPAFSPLPLGEGPGVRAVTHSHTPRKPLFKGTLAMLALIGISLFAVGVVSTTPRDISGTWQGEDWGQVTLTQTAPGEYAGTYTDTVVKEKESGKIELKWSRIERRFNGTWSEGEDRFGDLSIRVVDGEIRGALTTDRKSKINPGTPRLADFAWTRTETKPSEAGRGNVIWDVSNDFSIAKGNPNGTWTYGMVYKSAFVPYTKKTDDGQNRLWVGRLAGDSSPELGVKYGPPANGVQSGQFFLHPGPHGEASVARWTAPAGFDSKVQVQGQFLPGDYGVMQVGIFVNGTPQVTTPYWTSSDSGAFSFSVSVSAGNTIDFAVYGGYIAGATPLSAIITNIPEAVNPSKVASPAAEEAIKRGLDFLASRQTLQGKDLPDLEVLRARFNVARAQADDSTAIRRAVAGAKVAKAEYEARKKANEKNPGSVPKDSLIELSLKCMEMDLAVERAELNQRLAREDVAIAKAELEFARARDASPPPREFAAAEAQYALVVAEANYRAAKAKADHDIDLRYATADAQARKAVYEAAADALKSQSPTVAKDKLEPLLFHRHEADAAIEIAKLRQRAAIEAAGAAKAELDAARRKAADVESTPGTGWNPGAGNEAASAAGQERRAPTAVPQATRPLEVDCEKNRVVIKAWAPAGTRISFYAGDRNNGWGCVFPRATGFTASLEYAETGLNCRVVPDTGDPVLTLVGAKHIGSVVLSGGRFIFRNGPVHKERDGSTTATIGQWAAKSGEVIEIGVTLTPPQSEGKTPTNNLNAMAYLVKFEQGATRFLKGDKITIGEVRGTADSFAPGNLYRITGTYTLASQDRAILLASITMNDLVELMRMYSLDPTVRDDYVNPDKPTGAIPGHATGAELKVQRAVVNRGAGTFTLFLPMSHKGLPHVSFYSFGKDGEGFGANYFGTGDSVLKQWWGSKDGVGTRTQLEPGTQEGKTGRVPASDLFRWPADFDLIAKGTLEPVDRRDVYAGADGNVAEFSKDLDGKPIEHGSRVKKGQLLLRLSNPTLNAQMEEVSGQLATETQLVADLKHERTTSAQSMKPDDYARLTGQLAEANQKLLSLESQSKIVKSKLAELELYSPIDGQIVTSKEQFDKLKTHPMQKGQSPLCVANPEGEWELVLHVPDDRMDFIERAKSEVYQRNEPLRVLYILVTDPGTTLKGTVKRVDVVKKYQGNVAEIRVRINKQDIDPTNLREGTTVTGKVHFSGSMRGSQPRGAEERKSVPSSPGEGKGVGSHGY